MPTQPWRICGRDTVAVPREVLSGRFLSRSESGCEGPGRFGVFALAQDVDVLGEIAAVVQGVEGQVEVAVDDEHGVIGHGGEPLG